MCPARTLNNRRLSWPQLRAAATKRSRGGDVMTIGKMTAIGFGLVGAFALGVWTGPHITQRASDPTSAVHESIAVPAAPDEAPAADPARIARRAAAARTAAVDVTAPALQDRLKPVLNRGANM